MNLRRLLPVCMIVPGLLLCPVLAGTQQHAEEDSRGDATEEKRREDDSDDSKNDRNDKSGKKDEYDSFVDRNGDRVDDRWEGFSKRREKKEREEERRREEEKARKESESRKRQTEKKPSPSRDQKSGAGGQRRR